MSKSFGDAIDCIKEAIKQLRLKKRSNMTADYTWALEDIDTLIDEVERQNEHQRK